MGPNTPKIGGAGKAPKVGSVAAGTDRKLEVPLETKLLYIQEKGSIYFHDDNSRKIIGLEGSHAYLFLGPEPVPDPATPGIEGDLRIRDEAGRDVFSFDGGGAKLSLGAQGHGAFLAVHDKGGNAVLSLDGNEGSLTIGSRGHGGTLSLVDADNRVMLTFDPTTAALYVGNKGNEGDVIVRNQAGKETIKLDGGQCTVSVRNESGSETVKIDGKTGDVLLLGADCAEEFDVAGGGVDAGTVLVIHDEGTLCPCVEAYDRRVAGVASGANGVNPGIILGRSQAPGARQPVALSGRVYCKVDARPAPIRVGDLLTTSPVPGHAMKATDATRAFGAVIGKALRPLESGRGMIPILVALQ
jgi:hypothetical protein